MRSLLRPADRTVSNEQTSFGDIVMDLTTRRVQRGGHSLHIGATEFRLLHFLMRHPRRVFSRAEVLDSVWGHAVDIESPTLDVHVGRLRKALARAYGIELIHTVHRTGYALDDISK